MGSRTVGSLVWPLWETIIARMGGLVASEHSGALAQAKEKKKTISLIER